MSPVCTIGKGESGLEGIVSMVAVAEAIRGSGKGRDGEVIGNTAWGGVFGEVKQGMTIEYGGREGVCTGPSNSKDSMVWNLA